MESSQFSYKLGTKNGESLTGGGPSLELPRICQQSIGQNSVPWPHLPARKAGDVMQLCFGENEKWFHSGQSLTQITRHFTTNSRFVLHFCDFQCQQIFLFFNNFDAGYSQHFHHPTPYSAGLLQKNRKKTFGLPRCASHIDQLVDPGLQPHLQPQSRWGLQKCEQPL